MRTYDFDQLPERRGTASYKWDQSKVLFGDPDILPMWVADMDFQAPAEVVEALEERARHGYYGYTFRTDSYYEAIIDWQRRRHGWEIEKSWISSSPGVVTALSLSIEILSEPGDKVVLQAPVYYPFYDVIRLNDRELVNNPLKLENERFTFDLEDLESKLDEKTKVLLLCNPHNPGGRVWTKEELKAIGELCVRRGVTIVSDEIHGDLVYRGYKHVPMASVSKEIAEHTITCTAPSKTFNLPGLQTSTVIIANPELRRKYNRRLKALSIHMEGYFGATAMEVCYTHGEAWLEQCIDYLQGNLDELVQFFEEQLPQVKVIRPEGTYLVWIDCRAIAEDAQTLKELMYREAKVAFNEGSTYGKEGEGFLRVNIACPRSLMREGLKRFAEAVQKHQVSVQ